jgi:hypothetical protein
VKNSDILTRRNGNDQIYVFYLVGVSVGVYLNSQKMGQVRGIIFDLYFCLIRDATCTYGFVQ